MMTRRGNVSALFEGTAKASTTWERVTDRVTGYLGLFLIGAFGWAYEHFGRTPAAGRPVANSPQP